ncbi:MAG: hypothetical protein H6Q74_3118 [Firmicutes bacterium]|nr:hypothetical protein [Bacillota bacterium]
MLFKAKISRFGSLVSLVGVTAMLALFALALPEFLSSVAGRVFTVVWSMVAIIVFVAHARRLTIEQRRLPLELVKFSREHKNKNQNTSKRRAEVFRRERG